jgi:hypothetical protein
MSQATDDKPYIVLYSDVKKHVIIKPLRLIASIPVYFSEFNMRWVYRHFLEVSIDGVISILRVGDSIQKHITWDVMSSPHTYLSVHMEPVRMPSGGTCMKYDVEVIIGEEYKYDHSRRYDFSSVVDFYKKEIGNNVVDVVMKDKVQMKLSDVWAMMQSGYVG